MLQKILQLPGAKEFIKKAMRKIEDKSPGYKKFQKKLDDMIARQTEKLAKEQKVKPSSAKFSDKDIDKGISKEDRIAKQYFKKKPKIFKKVEDLKKGGKINIDGNKFVARQYGGKIGRGSN
tara:strand:- start:157 stop:519 length:363 start_codon:yes stop_codon:yes gene_type:complete